MSAAIADCALCGGMRRGQQHVERVSKIDSHIVHTGCLSLPPGGEGGGGGRMALVSSYSNQPPRVKIN